VLELQHFVDAVADGIPPLVSGRDALAAMRYVWEIQRVLADQGMRAPCPT
jgi:predicted dehydrogenase